MRTWKNAKKSIAVSVMGTDMDALLLPLAKAMNAAYSTPPTWENSDRTAHVVQTTVGGVLTFCWLGTMDLSEWINDDFNPTMEMDHGIGMVHQPSLKNVEAILPNIQKFLEVHGFPPYYMAGHSKGAREAALATAAMLQADNPPAATRLYECPRVGGSGLACYLATENIIGTRTYNAHGDDPITWLPIGFGWEDCCFMQRFAVPDDYDLASKHRMAGVIAGITGVS